MLVCSICDFTSLPKTNFSCQIREIRYNEAIFETFGVS